MYSQSINVIILVLIAILAIYFLYPKLTKIVDNKENMTTGVVINTTHPISSIIKNAQDTASKETMDMLKHVAPMTSSDSTYVNGIFMKTSANLNRMVDSMAGKNKFDIESVLCEKGPIYYAASASNVTKAILAKYKIRAGIAEGVADKVGKVVHKTTSDILNFASHADNDLSVFKITQNNQATMDALMDFHLKRQTPNDKIIRRVKPTPKDDAPHLKKIKNRTDDIINAVDTDHPLLGQNGSLLPNNNQKPLNLQISNLLAQQRRYYKKPQTVVRASTDFRGMPPALIENIMKHQSSKDPNSLHQSVNYNPIDILESGRGASNNYQTDEALASYFDQHKIPIVDNLAKIMNNVVDRNPGNLGSNRWANGSIKNDLKFGAVDEYWGDR